MSQVSEVRSKEEIWTPKTRTAEDIDGVLLGEGFGGDVLQWQVLRYPGVVDDDIDLEFPRSWMSEVVFGSRDQVGWTLWITHVRLDRNGVDAMGAFQRRSESGTGLRRGIGRIA